MTNEQEWQHRIFSVIYHDFKFGASESRAQTFVS